MSWVFACNFLRRLGGRRVLYSAHVSAKSSLRVSARASPWFHPPRGHAIVCTYATMEKRCSQSSPLLSTCTGRSRALAVDAPVFGSCFEEMRDGDRVPFDGGRRDSGQTCAVTTGTMTFHALQSMAAWSRDVFARPGSVLAGSPPVMGVSK